MQVALLTVVDHVFACSTEALKSAVIGDLGIAISSRGTRGWDKFSSHAAPEVLASQRFTFESDLYSAGCVLLDVMLLRDPHDVRDIPWGDLEGQPRDRNELRCTIVLWPVFHPSGALLVRAL